MLPNEDLEIIIYAYRYSLNGSFAQVIQYIQNKLSVLDKSQLQIIQKELMSRIAQAENLDNWFNEDEEKLTKDLLSNINCALIGKSISNLN